VGLIYVNICSFIYIDIEIKSLTMTLFSDHVDCIMLMFVTMIWKIKPISFTFRMLQIWSE